jgi:hypothetical protein
MLVVLLRCLGGIDHAGARVALAARDKLDCPASQT